MCSLLKIETETSSERTSFMKYLVIKELVQVQIHKTLFPYFLQQTYNTETTSAQKKARSHVD